MNHSGTNGNGVIIQREVAVAFTTIGKIRIARRVAICNTYFQEGASNALALPHMVAVQAYGVGDVMADGEVRAPGAEPSVVVREVNRLATPPHTDKSTTLLP